MMGLPHIDMNEVTRLTREGRLREAVDLLQGRSGRPAPEPARDAPAGGGSAGVVDLVPPAEPGGAWTEAGGVRTEAKAEPSEPSEPPAARRSGRPLRGLGDTIRDRLQGLDPRARRADVPVPPGARFEARQFEGPEGGRPYRLYVPSTGRADALVVMLHGCTQSPDDFALGTGMNAIAERDGFLVAYPAQTKAANPSKCWNWFRPQDQRRGTGEPAILAGITRAVATEFGIDPGRIAVAGLSAGGAAALVLAETYPDLYAAVGVHSGLAYRAASDVPSALAAMRSGVVPATEPAAGALVPTIVFHGSADRTVHPANAEAILAGLRDRLRRGEPGVTETSEEDGARVLVTISRPDGTPVVEHWTLKGGGHAWSGGDSAGSFTEPGGPDASAEMARFFARHRRGR